jgi:hypothetical protein
LTIQIGVMLSWGFRLVTLKRSCSCFMLNLFYVFIQHCSRCADSTFYADCVAWKVTFLPKCMASSPS